MTEPMLRPDCTRCAALCCVAPAFDRSEDFAVDKPAGVACPNLTADHRCAIHADLARRGFRGCAHYDCMGAGQRVTQEMFAGRSWRDDPAIAGAMFEAFRRMRQVHALLELLETAGRLPLTAAQRQTHNELRHALDPDGGWTPSSLAAFERGPLPAEVGRFVMSLRGAAASDTEAAGALRAALSPALRHQQ
jgi:hypothetical protein